MKRKTIQLWIVAAAVGVGLATVYVSLSAQQARAPEVAIGATDLGGVVTGTNGPEAGVWVIAETADLPTKFAKMVVTDDRGRYVIPDLPKATYNVWVRGYGLVDSPKVKATPGQHLNLTATAAPTPAAAAEYYPGVYWYSMMRIPAASEFPGTGTSGNGINPVMKNATLLDRHGQELLPVVPRVGFQRRPDIPGRMGTVCKFASSRDPGLDKTPPGRSGEREHGCDSEPAWAAEGAVALRGLDGSYRRRRIAFRQAGAASGRRTQRRHQHVGVVHAQGLSSRCDLDRQAQSPRQRQRLDLRIAGRKHRHGAGAQSAHE